MLFSKVSPCYAIIPQSRLNYKAQKRPPLKSFSNREFAPYTKNFLQMRSEIVLSWHVSSNTQNAPGAFSHKGFVFRALPHQRTARIPRAPKARAKKNWRFCGKYCPKFTLKCCSLRFRPATRYCPLCTALITKSDPPHKRMTPPRHPQNFWGGSPVTSPRISFGGGHQNLVTSPKNLVGGGHHLAVTSPKSTLGGVTIRLSWGIRGTVGHGYFPQNRQFFFARAFGARGILAIRWWGSARKTNPL